MFRGNLGPLCDSIQDEVFCCRGPEGGHVDSVAVFLAEGCVVCWHTSETQRTGPLLGVVESIEVVQLMSVGDSQNPSVLGGTRCCRRMSKVYRWKLLFIERRTYGTHFIRHGFHVFH